MLQPFCLSPFLLDLATTVPVGDDLTTSVTGRSRSTCTCMLQRIRVPLHVHVHVDLHINVPPVQRGGAVGLPYMHRSRFTCTDRPWKSQRLKIIIVNIIGDIVLIIEKVCARPFLFHVLLRALLVDSAKKKKKRRCKNIG